MKHLFRILAEKLTGTHIFRQLPLGIDEFADVKGKFPHHDFGCIFDVGANVGQTARHIRHHFPKAIIHALEPISSTYAKLVQNTYSLQVNTHQLALGAEDQEIEVFVHNTEKNSVLNSLQANNQNKTDPASKVEIVTVQRLGTFCAAQGISKIDFLKIDTEGFDLEVLKGAGVWIDNQQIPFVLAEVSMNPTNTFHVQLEAVKQFMEAKGYFLFGLYDQTHEWKAKKPVLRRANALFISGTMAGM